MNGNDRGLSSCAEAPADRPDHKPTWTETPQSVSERDGRPPGQKVIGSGAVTLAASTSAERALIGGERPNRRKLRAAIILRKWQRDPRRTATRKPHAEASRIEAVRRLMRVARELCVANGIDFLAMAWKVDNKEESCEG